MATIHAFIPRSPLLAACTVLALLATSAEATLVNPRTGVAGPRLWRGTVLHMAPLGGAPVVFPRRGPQLFWNVTVSETTDGCDEGATLDITFEHLVGPHNTDIPNKHSTSIECVVPGSNLGFFPPEDFEHASGHTDRLVLRYSKFGTGRSRLLIQLRHIAAPVPEPGAWALFLAGGGLLAWTARRRPR